MEKLITNDTITINASASKVWEVLTTPGYIRQWDDVPESFTDSQLKQGSVLHWAGYSKLTVTRFEPNRLLKMNMYVEKWERPESEFDVAYTFRLKEDGHTTSLTISIGDFASAPGGQELYDTSVEFGRTAAEKIKALAEES